MAWTEAVAGNTRCSNHSQGWRDDRVAVCSGSMGPWADVLERTIEAGHGLQAIHAGGLVHGDVKPANILIKAGLAKLCDLDLAAFDGGMSM